MRRVSIPPIFLSLFIFFSLWMALVSPCVLFQPLFVFTRHTIRSRTYFVPPQPRRILRFFSPVKGSPSLQHFRMTFPTPRRLCPPAQTPWFGVLFAPGKHYFQVYSNPPELTAHWVLSSNLFQWVRHTDRGCLLPLFLCEFLSTSRVLSLFFFFPRSRNFASRRSPPPLSPDFFFFPVFFLEGFISSSFSHFFFFVFYRYCGFHDLGL